MLLVVAYVPYKSGGPEVATQAVTRLTKLENTLSAAASVRGVSDLGSHLLLGDRD